MWGSHSHCPASEGECDVKGVAVPTVPGCLTTDTQPVWFSVVPGSRWCWRGWHFQGLKGLARTVGDCNTISYCNTISDSNTVNIMLCPNRVLHRLYSQ